MRQSEFTVRAACAADIPAITALEKEIYTNPWTWENFEDALRFDFSVLLVAEADAQIVGYANLVVVTEEACLNNIAVTASRRGRGVGDALLKQVIAQARARGALRLTLEVREKNDSARHLYEKNGFHGVGMRRGFYRDPVDDAVLMLLDLEKNDAHFGN